MDKNGAINHLNETFDLIEKLDRNQVINKISEYRLENDIGIDKPIVIYGAGKFGRQVYIKLVELGLKVNYFIDKAAKKNDYLFDIPVYRIDDSDVEVNLKKQCKVVIAVTVTNTEIEDIKCDLKRVGYKEIFFNNNFFLYFNNVFIDEFRNMRILQYKDNIIKACNLFEDNHSREIYAKSIRARTVWDFDVQIESKGTIQYFKPNCKMNKGFNCFVDCGAFTGDTLEKIVKYYKCYEYIGFEPSYNNFIKLNDTAERLKGIISKIKLFPYATWDKNGTVLFSGESDMTGTINNKGIGIEVKSVTLDTILDEIAPTMIKMDVEGSEKNSIYGAKRVLMKQKPDLAICVYHNITDFWEMPLLIKELVPEYSFYLRCHGIATLETVLYATINIS